MELKVPGGFLILKPAPSDAFPTARLYPLNLPRQHHNWAPNVCSNTRAYGEYFSFKSQLNIFCGGNVKSLLSYQFYLKPLLLPEPPFSMSTVPTSLSLESIHGFPMPKGSHLENSWLCLSLFLAGMWQTPFLMSAQPSPSTVYLRKSWIL